MTPGFMPVNLFSWLDERNMNGRPYAVSPFPALVQMCRFRSDRAKTSSWERFISAAYIGHKCEYIINHEIARALESRGRKFR